MPTEPESPNPSLAPISVRRAALYLGLALVFALLPRLWLLGHTEVLENDATIFLWMAQNVQAGEPSLVPEYPYHPLTAWMIAAFEPATAAVVGQGPDAWALAGQWVSLVTGMIALCGLYLLGRWTMGHWPGIVGVLLAGWIPEFAHRSVDALSDAPAAAGAVWTLVGAVAAHRALAKAGWRVVAWPILAGASCGLGYLARPEVLAAGISAAAVLCVPERGQPWRVKRRLLGWAGILAGAAPLVLPYAISIGGISLKKRVGDLVTIPAGRAYELLASTNPGDLHLLHNMYVVIRKWARAAHPAVILLGLICLVAWAVAWRRRVRPAYDVRPTAAGAAAIWLTIGGWLAMLFLLWMNVGYLSVRHAIIPGLLLAPLAGAGAIVAARVTLAVVGRIGIKQIPWVSYLGWIGVPMAIMAIHLYQPLHVGKSHNVQCWKWLQAHTAGDAVILASSYRGGYYTDRQIEIVKSGYLRRPGKLQEFIDEMPVRPDWLVLDSQRLQQLGWDEQAFDLTDLGYTLQQRFRSDYPRERNDLMVYQRID